MRFVPVALFLALPLLAANTYEVFLPAGANQATLRTQLSQLLPPSVPCRYTELSGQCQTMPEAQRQARAIAAGVTQLPCLAMSNSDGYYALLPLHGLQQEDIERAEETAPPAGHNAAAAQRLFSARLFLLCARLSLSDMDDASLASAIKACRALMADGQASQEHRQFLGLRCLYPLLMLQYSRGYAGAHTPGTEAKLLESIAALEAARDVNPLSTLGRQAHEEREKLRAARIKSRQYE